MPATFTYIVSVPTDEGRRNGYQTAVEATCACNKVTMRDVGYPDTCRGIAVDEFAACECGQWEKALKAEQGKFGTRGGYSRPNPTPRARSVSGIERH